MSKPTSAYDGMIVTEKMYDAVLVKNSESKWFRFDLWADRVFIMNRREEYDGWADFDDGYTDNDIEELHSIYVAMFGKSAVKNAHKKTLTKAIWIKRYHMSADRSDTYRQGGIKDSITGERERKRNLDRRGYRAIESNNAVHMQNQALIVHRAIIKYHVSSDKEYITEGDVKDLMIALRDAGDLKTKQDPFRIFQYYRPALIKAGLLEFTA